MYYWWDLRFLCDGTEDLGFKGCDAMSLGEWFKTFEWIGAFIFKFKQSCPLKMKELLSFDTLGTTHSMTQHYILEDKVLSIIP